MRGQTKERNGLTVAPFEAHAGRDAVNNDEADDVAAVILNETLEMLDLLPDRVPYILLTLRVRIDIWSLGS